MVVIMNKVVHKCGGYVYWDEECDNLACTECPERIIMEDCTCDDGDVEIAIVDIKRWEMGSPAKQSGQSTRDGRWQVDLCGRPVAGQYPFQSLSDEKLANLGGYIDVPRGRWSR